MRKPGEVSLERALSKLGIASRTQARAWISEGRVRVDGVVIRNPGKPVVPERIRVEIDGKLEERRGFRVLALHKPSGFVTTRSDERGRPTVFDLLPGERHLAPVGRLDLATTGLLLFTNDTRLSDWLTDPLSRIEREYVVTVRGEVFPPTLERLLSGVEDDGEWLRADRVELLKGSGRESHLKVVLCQGKNREVRRLFESQGHPVSRLKRIRYGGIALGELASGKYREVTPDELRRAFPEAPEFKLL